MPRHSLFCTESMGRLSCLSKPSPPLPSPPQPGVPSCCACWVGTWDPSSLLRPKQCCRSCTFVGLIPTAAQPGWHRQIPGGGGGKKRWERDPSVQLCRESTASTRKQQEPHCPLPTPRESDGKDKAAPFFLGGERGGGTPWRHNVPSVTARRARRPRYVEDSASCFCLEMS